VGFTGVRAILATTLAAAALALALAPAAQGAWGPAETVGPAGGFGYDGPSIAARSNGFRAIAYTNGTHATIATARAGGRFGKPRRIPNGRVADYDLVLEPRVEVDEHGNALVIWAYDDVFRLPDDEAKVDEGCCRPLRFTVLRANGRFDPVRRLTPRGRDVGLGDAVIENGRVHIVWTEERDVNGAAKPGVLYYRQATGGRRGTTRTVDPGGSRAVALSVVKGRARVLLERYGRAGAADDDLYEAVATRGGAFRPPRVVAPAGGLSFHEPAVATAGNGAQAIAYVAADGATGRVYAGTRSRSGPFQVRPLPGSNPGLGEPLPAVAAAGPAAVVWQAVTDDGWIYAATAPARGRAFGAPRRPFRHGRESPVELRAAVGPRGGVAVAWVDSRDSTLRGGFLDPIGRRIGGVQVLARGERDEVFGLPNVLVDDSGRALIVYLDRGFVTVRRALVR
jgi:hypothetical protein